MPIFDYRCLQCNQECELIVLTGTLIRCPACGSETLDRLISSFAVSTTTTRGQSLSAIRRKNTGKAREEIHAEQEYDRHHRHEID